MTLISSSSASVFCCQPLQTVFLQNIRLDLDLKTVWHFDGIPGKILRKNVNFEKKSANGKKACNSTVMQMVYTHVCMYNNWVIAHQLQLYSMLRKSKHSIFTVHMCNCYKCYLIWTTSCVQQVLIWLITFSQLALYIYLCSEIVLKHFFLF